KRVRAILLSGITIAPSIVRDEYNRDNDKVSLSYLRISGSELKDSLDMSKEAVARWTSENSEAIKQYYETNKYKYTNVEKSAHARHILIKVAKDADETAKAEAKMKITTLLQRVKDGEDFAQLATLNSEDEGSAKKGGDLGYNPKGVMVPAFDDAMFALAPGQISDVVETEFGYHIIKLEDFREGTVSLEDATAEIAEKLYKEKGSETLAKKLSDEINKLVKAGKTLEEIVELSKNTSSPADAATPVEGETEPAPAAAPSLELPKGVELSVQTTAPFGKNAPVVPGIGKSQELLDDAFTLTKKSEMLKKIYSIDGNYFAVALNEHKTPTDEGFAAESEKIKDGLLAKKMMTVLKDKIMALREKAMADGKIESEIALASLEQKKSAPVKPAEAAKKPAQNK
ncbi:MAG: peptidylprolyl isomerase, partial [Deltaproteobacteria bacterium]|nr:peptidylprolyl isomerase [Deltaproteobacteria bacterium]